MLDFNTSARPTNDALERGGVSVLHGADANARAALTLDIAIHSAADQGGIGIHGNIKRNEFALIASPQHRLEGIAKDIWGFANAKPKIARRAKVNLSQIASVHGINSADAADVLLRGFAALGRKPALVVIDAIEEHHGHDEDNSSELIQFCNLLAKQSGCHALLTCKTGSVTNALTSAADKVVELTAHGDGVYAAEFTKSRT